jgi:hypothetical protein
VRDDDINGVLLIDFPLGPFVNPATVATKIDIHENRHNENRHTHSRHPNPPVCGQCVATSHQAEPCSSPINNSVYHRPHRARFRKERQKLPPSTNFISTGSIHPLQPPSFRMQLPAQLSDPSGHRLWPSNRARCESMISKHQNWWRVK